MSIDKLISERKSVHGEFSDNAVITDRLIEILRSGKNWAKMCAVKRIALTYIAGKIARILSGDADHHDHWQDIQGYAKCVIDRLPKASVPTEEKMMACRKCLQPYPLPLVTNRCTCGQELV